MPNPARRAPRRIDAPLRLVALGVTLAASLTACGTTASPPRTIELRSLNGSGVTGTVSFTGQDGRTGVDITVSPNGNLDMPAHIHPGTCDSLTPQPKFPLENVRDGVSTTLVPASIDELFAGDLAVNIHKSNDDLKTYTACVDIR